MYIFEIVRPRIIGQWPFKTASIAGMNHFKHLSLVVGSGQYWTQSPLECGKDKKVPFH